MATMTADFINDAALHHALEQNTNPDAKRIRDIIAKARSIQTLTLDETATLLNVTDPALWNEMSIAGGEIKKSVYDNRIVTFAPLYMSNKCVNNCSYCGFRTSNSATVRRQLTLEEIKNETAVLAGTIGHKRLVVVYGEHPDSNVSYIADTIKTIYDIKVQACKGIGRIRRVNVNAAPMSVDDLKILKETGLGTFQVFQETYHHETYKKVHTSGKKADYGWRLSAMHRAMEAGVDDVGLGVLFGLYDWRFEVLGLVAHARELERAFGIGPHTISFPRLEPAANTPFNENLKYKVSDEDFKKLITVIRLSVPYTGMIVTARENAAIRRDVIALGCTQTDASSRIGIGAYSDRYNEQEAKRQQFLLGDTRSLDELVRELSDRGYITSFCTAGYRCGRTGACIMDLLRTGAEGKFCKLNAVLTFREWLDDFASPETKAAGEVVLQKELNEIKVKLPKVYPTVKEYYDRICTGERDLYV